MSAKWVVWAMFLAFMVIGCSASKSNKPTAPLPPGVDPSNLFNTVPPAPVQLTDARPYYLPPDEVPKVAVDPQRVRQGAMSEFGARAFQAEYRKQQQQKDAIEKNSARRQIEQQKEENQKDRMKLNGIDSSLKQVEANLKPLEGLLQRNLFRWLPSTSDLEEASGQKLRDPSVKTKEDINRREKEIADAEKKLPPAPPPELPPAGAKHDILILSGGASRSLYLYGVVCGWSDSGTMPEFSVVTGVSGGSIAAAALFGGKEYLDVLRRTFLTLNQTRLLHGDAWERKRFPHPFGLGTASVADTTKIRKLLQQITSDPTFFAKIAAEHAKGRRLYIGTCNLDTQRFVSWDIGAIASEGTPESRKLIEDIITASSAIPPLLEPSKITVTIDGQRFEEFHVDGGTARNLFFYPPADWPGEEEDRKTGYRLLAGARVHVVLGGKVYETPEKTKDKLLSTGLRSVGTLLGSLQRAELARIYSYCLDRGMTMTLSAIPPDMEIPAPSTFDPVESCKMFREGYTRAQDGRAFGPPTAERAVSEDRARRSTVLSSEGTTEIGTVAPVIPLRRPPGR